MLGTADKQKRPNFLVILADDLGFSDVGCFGSEINTPNIDKLAASGVRMTDYYAAAACSPTRSMLLSGTDNHIAGIGVMAEHRNFNLKRWNVPGHEGYLNHRIAALPELLQDNGYHTLISGKWHLGLKPEYLPDQRGFDRSFALLPGCGNHYGFEPQFADSDLLQFFERNTPLYVRDGVKVDLAANVTNDPAQFFSSDYYATNLIQYLDERPTDKPFFAYLPFASPHWPLQVHKGYRDKYKGVYDDGPEALRQRRLAKLREMGLISADAVAHDVVAPDMSEWEEMTDEERALSARAMETYAGMVENMDWNIGRVLDHLDKIGERENTFIVFQSDNGAEGASLEAMPVLGQRFMDVIGKYYDNSLENIGEYNSYVWYGPRWAQASTAPSRLYKMYSTEGGIKVPMIVNFSPWTQKHGGEIFNAFATVMDIVPTILELAGIQHPGKSQLFRGRQVEALRGKSWLPFFSALTEKTDLSAAPQALHTVDDPAVGWELFGRAALRSGGWKIVFMPRWAHGKGAWELFDLSTDPGETRDLAQDDPAKLAELVELWEEYVQETGVVWDGELQPQPVPDHGLERTSIIGGDPLEDTRGWMQTRN
ncbi:alkaline-phosphatase-like protein [Mycena rosella]|uniref:Alkaline-phosphatase-like protein n=1 Tax=Mycena rosella TaxID=1033263 RepID=A0AAD7DGN0_MYCRO|nr:alkaline-phosphatase-like protein [Mycena rosella]